MDSAVQLLHIEDYGNLTERSSFESNPFGEEFISEQINNLSFNEAKGCDGISTNILKLAKTTIIKPITNMFNLRERSGSVVEC